MYFSSSVWTVRFFLIASASLSYTSASEAALASSKPPTIFRRQDGISCSAVDPKLPDNFRCPAGSICISLDNSSSGLCCPETESCTNIATISCDVQTQNLTSFPNTDIFTTRLGDQLPQCGNKCCPFGYACLPSSTASSVCSIIKGTSIVGTTDTSSSSSETSTSASSTSSLTTSATTTGTSSTVTATSASNISSPALHNGASCNKFPVGVFLAGFFPGIFIGAFLMLAWVICSGRHRKPNSRSSSGSSVYKPTISDPIPLDSNGGLRTDFLRRTAGRAKSMFSTTQPSPGLAPKNWKMPTPPVQNNIPAASGGLPVTPERRFPNQSQTENTRRYSPPNGAVQNPNPAAIAPLRGMAAPRFQKTNNMGSPFQTPPNNNVSQNDQDDRGVSTFSGVSELSAENEAVTLTPARYNGGNYGPTSRVRSGEREEVSRPNTTFTEMLHEAGFPDPLPERSTPAVPKIPNGYGGGGNKR